MTPDRLGTLIGVATLVNFLLLPINARLVDGMGPVPSIAATTIASILGLLLMAEVPAEWALGGHRNRDGGDRARPAGRRCGLCSKASIRPIRAARWGLFRMAGDIGLAGGPVLVTGTIKALGLPLPAGFSIAAVLVLAAGLVFSAARMGARPRVSAP